MLATREKNGTDDAVLLTTLRPRSRPQPCRMLPIQHQGSGRRIDPGRRVDDAYRYAIDHRDLAAAAPQRVWYGWSARDADGEGTGGRRGDDQVAPNLSRTQISGRTRDQLS